MATLPNLNIPGVAAGPGRKVAEVDVIWSVDFHAHRRVRLNGHKGTLLTLSSDRNVETLRQYGNVVVLRGAAEYAPEVTKRFLFVSDKRFI